VKQSIWAGVISRLRIVDAGGEIADGLAQGNGMLAHNRLSITAGRPQIWLKPPQPDRGLLCCSKRSENEGSPEGYATSYGSVVAGSGVVATVLPTLPGKRTLVLGVGGPVERLERNEAAIVGAMRTAMRRHLPS